MKPFEPGDRVRYLGTLDAQHYLGTVADCTPTKLPMEPSYWRVCVKMDDLDTTAWAAAKWFIRV